METDTVKDINLSNCNIDSSVVQGLSQQIIAEMNLIIPNVLVNSEDLNIEASGAAVSLFLQPAAKEALRLAIKKRGIKLKVTSAYRTCAQQYILFRRYEAGQLCGIEAAARPGLSNHEDGFALDIPDFEGWKPFLTQHGWEWFGLNDRVHFTFLGGGTRDDVSNIGVQAFQRLWNKNNPNDRIAEDGDFGPETEERLNQSPVNGFQGSRLLGLREPNLEGDDVRELQQLLNNADIGLHIQIDGIFGEETDKAVRLFQGKRSLSLDGVVGPATWKELKRQAVSGKTINLINA